MSGLRLRYINCPCGHEALVSYQVTLRRIYVEKKCYSCKDRQWHSYARVDAVDAKIPLAPGAWKLYSEHRMSRFQK